MKDYKSVRVLVEKGFLNYNFAIVRNYVDIVRANLKQILDQWWLVFVDVELKSDEDFKFIMSTILGNEGLEFEFVEIDSSDPLFPKAVRNMVGDPTKGLAYLMALAVDETLVVKVLYVPYIEVAK